VNNRILAALLLHAVAVGVRFHLWRLGFKQSSLCHIARVLQVCTFSVFQCLPLFWRALFPSGFRLQVNQMTQKRSSKLLLSVTGIQHCVPRRTLSAHPAIPRHSPLTRVMGFSVSFRRPSATRPRSLPSMTAEALRPATALPVTLGGRHATDYYGLSAPVPALVISRPTMPGVGPGSGVAHVASVVLP
jgi:hypothetical protein